MPAVRPDPVAGRLLLDLPESLSDGEVMQAMWQAGGATEEDPTPYLKNVLCRVVSISAVVRHVRPDGEVVVNLRSLPHNPHDSGEAREERILSRFLTALGQRRPQLVGYNSVSADIRALVQRGVVQGLEAAGFCLGGSGPHSTGEAGDSQQAESDEREQNETPRVEDGSPPCLVLGLGNHDNY